MNYFFLYNESIDLKDFGSFKSGMTELVVIEREEDDHFRKHETIWNLAVITHMYSNFGGQEEQAIYKFIEQLSSTQTYINSQDTFNEIYPNCGNAFLGIDFSNSNIPYEIQVTHSDSFDNFKKGYYASLNVQGNIAQLNTIVAFLFPTYSFSLRAMGDITYWNSTSPDLYKRLLELLHDVKLNPFTGGLGKTEVLKNKSGVASKRLDGEHRITYSVNDTGIEIHSCKGHYE